jgi:hypothetical protein
MQDEAKASFAVIRYNQRTYASGGVVAVVKGRSAAEKLVDHFEKSQSSEDRHAGWRYFMEASDLKPGMDAQEATDLRQSRLDIRESKS